MHLLFPASPLNRREPDEFVRDQCEVFKNSGYGWSLIVIESLMNGGDGEIICPIPAGATLLYRGWMLSEVEYAGLCAAVTKCGATMLVSLNQYLAAHHLPNWYHRIAEFTPETVVMAVDDATPEAAAALGWSGFFIKDYVKSLKTSVGSRITDAKAVPKVLEEMRRFRGNIEGGVCLRRIEDFEPDSEQRYFVLDGVPHAPDREAAIPEIVVGAAARIPSPFFSIDVARRTDGILRIVEIGDGQVSDLVGWTAERFVELWKDRKG